METVLAWRQCLHCDRERYALEERVLQILLRRGFFSMFSKLDRKGMGQETSTSSGPQQVERRRHPRFRFSEQILIYRKDGSSYRATTSEISLGGLSAASSVALRPGEEVRLSLLVGDQVSAIVRRRIGTIYGLEFISVPPWVKEEIHVLCGGSASLRGPI
jgi:PilZ domain